MTTYTIEVNHDEDGVSVVVKDLDPDTMVKDQEAIAYALEEALRITRENLPQRFQ
jgi:hypothetical protein